MFFRKARQLRRLKAERDFLLARANAAGAANLGEDRWTGMSSNALVRVAFGGEPGWRPSDGGDLAACYRTVMRLPAHLRTAAVLDELERGEREILEKYPDQVAWACEKSGWPGREALDG